MNSQNRKTVQSKELSRTSIVQTPLMKGRKLKAANESHSTVKKRKITFNRCLSCSQIRRQKELSEAFKAKKARKI